jgi:hypothetical protein
MFLVGASLVVGTSTSAAAASAEEPAGPDHIITCSVSPYVPAKVPGGLQYGGKISCSDVLDIRYTTYILWRCSTTCVREGEFYYNSPSPATVTKLAIGPCRVGTFRYHTQIILEGFHGNWQTISGDSHFTNWTC